MFQESRLEELKIVLPTPPSPVAAYIPAVRTGDLVFVSGQLPMSGGQLTVTGKVPPKWAVPSDARNSLLIEKLNVTSIKTPSKYAWPLGESFTDADVAGGTRTDHAKLAGLTRDELVKLIRTIDMGGQYYARQNSDFKPFGNGDPVGGKY